MAEIRKIAINTGGGDAPGLNAVIRAATLCALSRGWEVWGIKYGYRGLIDTSQLIPLTRDTVRGIAHVGGSILGTANKGSPFEFPVQTATGVELTDISGTVVKNFHAKGFDALVCIGGDGSLRIASRFADMGMPIMGVPKTIDNDLAGTSSTFGFDTAVATATDAIGKLHTTAEAHERVMVVEVMGRNAGWIALHAGLSGSADVILMPEIPFDLEKVAEAVRTREAAGRHFTIVVVAEGAKEKGGGIHKERRVMVLGHLQRGGGPTAYDRLLGFRFGAAAIRALAHGERNVMVALTPPTVQTIPLSEAVSKMKTVPLDCDTMLTAREMGVCFGD
jgi:6-phosphofructokinase 1